MSLAPKHSRESNVATRHLLMPRDVNHHGTAFGGFIMSLIDGAAAMAASRHSGRPVVTVSIDSLSFLAPMVVGDHVVLDAKVTYTGKTSIEVMVVVSGENPVKNTNFIATRAFLTFVALGDDGKPCEVPGLLCETEEEKEALSCAEHRVRERKEMRKNHECR